MKEKTLLIMAAGMGSRFGGLKQIEPVGPNGEFIIDYSVSDAIKAGFTKVVFIIKKENYDLFKETIAKRFEHKINVCYAFQEKENLPKNYTCPPDRIKPWGTAHAIMCAKEYVNSNFLVINSDDFYGEDAYFKASEFLEEVNDNSREYAIIGYEVGNTINETGSVKRGVIKSKNGYVTDIIESLIECNDNVTASPLNGMPSFTIKKDALVSMNMVCFTKEIFNYLETNFKKFLNDNKDNILNCEYLIPNILDKGIKEKECKVRLIKTNSKWLGVTYKEDLDKVKREIKKLILEKKY